jgi:hypothetical protein
MPDRTELALSFRQTVSQLHNRGIEIDESLRRVVLEKVETTRACGVALESAKADLRRSEFEQLRTDLGLSQDAIDNYLKFARRTPAPIIDFREALSKARDAALSTGLLPFNHDGHGRQIIHQPNFFSRVTNLIQTISADWAKFITRKPLVQWRDEEKEQFCATLIPLLRIHKAVRDSMHR